MSYGSDSVRLTLHVLAAAVWVGGQFSLAGLVPTLRRAGPDAPRQAAQAFARLAWPAFGVLVATGIWNVAATQRSAAGQAVLDVKLGVVALSGVAAWAHSRAAGPRALAVWGALSALSAVAAMYLGVVLAS